MKKFFTFVLSLILVCSSLSAAAEVVDEVTLTGGVLQIKGTIPREADDDITVTILADGAYWTSAAASFSGDSAAVSLEDYSYDDGDDIFDYLAWYGQFRAESDGSYCLTIPDYAGPSEPEIRIRLEDDNYYYYSPRDLIAVNNASTVRELEDAYRSSGFLWNAISATYAKLTSDELKSAFWQGCLDYRNNLKSREFASFSEAAEAAEAGYFAARLALCTDRSDLEELYGEFASEGTASDSYDIYTSANNYARADGIAYMSKTQKDALADYVLDNKKNFVTSADFVDGFNEQIVLFAVSSSQSKELVADILSKSSHLSGSLSTYDALSKSDKLQVAELLNAKAPYATLEALKTAVSDLCKAVTTAPVEGTTANRGNKPGSTAASVGGGTSAAIIPDTAVVCPFTDIDEVLWAKEAITELYSAGIVNGRSQTIFDPMGKVTRAEFVKMLVMAFGGPDASASGSFSDSTPADWHYGYISTAAAKGLVMGVGDGSFGASDTISRQDMAVIIARALNGDVSASDSGFADDYAISDYAKGAVAFARNQGIINGVGENCFEALSPVTRAQAAKVIYEIVKRGAV